MTEGILPEECNVPMCIYCPMANLSHLIILFIGGEYSGQGNFHFGRTSR